MKRNALITLLFSGLLVIGLLSGCAQTAAPGNSASLPAPSDSPTDQFEQVRVLAEQYLAQSQPKYMLPEELYKEYVVGKNAQYYLVDIRANSDFITSNIKGSVNIPYAQTMNVKKLANLPKDKTLIVIDYNGHWAAQTAVNWNLLGYQAVPLKYGIQGWTNDPVATGQDVFPTEPLKNTLVQTLSPSTQADLPQLMLPAKNSEETLRLLSNAYVERNYKGFIEAQDLMTQLTDGASNYTIVDIRDAEDFKVGHVEGSINIPLAELAKVESLKQLPSDKKIVLIGYDGLDASMATRILVILGYSAESLKYGLAYWNGDEATSGVLPIQSLVRDEFVLTPLNYSQPAAGPVGCG